MSGKVYYMYVGVHKVINILQLFVEIQPVEDIPNLT